MQTTERRGGTEQAVGELELPHVVLEITRGRAKHKRRDVRAAAFLIGTAPDCDLVLGDPRFDALYGYLFVQPGRVAIRHLGQGPPLCVGGRTVTWASLADADHLQMGPYEFQVRIQWPQAQADAEPAGGRREETGPAPIDCDAAGERLLRDVEGFSAVPRLTLFTGDGQCEIEDHAPRTMAVARAAWGQFQKKASS